MEAMAIVCLHCGASRTVPLSFTLPRSDSDAIPDADGKIHPRPLTKCIECGKRLYPGDVATTVSTSVDSVIAETSVIRTSRV